VTITAIIGVTMIGMATEGYLFTDLNWLLRIVTFIGAILLITANPIQDVFGIVILVAVILIQRSLRRKEQQALRA